MKLKRTGKSLACVVLAAGLGTRMKSSRPKVMHRLFDRPLLDYSIDALQSLNPQKCVVVIGDNQATLAAFMARHKGISTSIQKEQKGTAHALKSALSSLGKTFTGTVLVTTGDSPLLTSTTLKKFLGLHRRTKRSLSVLSFRASNPKGYGRIIRDSYSSPQKIVEEKDANIDEKAIDEVNSGVYAIESNALPYLKKIKINPLKGEYYLTDIVSIAISEGAPVGVYCVGEEHEFMGINTRTDLMNAHKILSQRTIEKLMDKGVTFIDANSVHVGPLVSIGADTIVYPNVFLHGKTKIGQDCILYPNVRIVDSTIRNGAIIKDGSIVEGSFVGQEAQVGPYAHLRPESIIGTNAKVGNFVETKKSVIGKGSKAMHLSYIGDASLGADVNVGAGTITCNYDGVHKHKTRIGNGVFIGSDTQLVAPLTVGKGAYIAAGTTVTKDVPSGMLAISRPQQIHKKRKKNR